MEKEIEKTKQIFNDGFESLTDYFEEKRAETIFEKEENTKKGKVALLKFSKSLIGKTEKINFRILIGQKKDIGDHIYEAVYLSNKKEPYLYIYKINKGKPCEIICKNFKEEDWQGYNKSKKYKSLTKFLEDVYNSGIYFNGKKEKKEDALNILIKGLKRTLEAIVEDEKDKGNDNKEVVKKVAKIVAIAAATTIIYAVATPAVGVIAQELTSGGVITGDVVAQAGEAALQGLQNLADPANLATKVVKKVVTKGAKFPISKG